MNLRVCGIAIIINAMMCFSQGADFTYDKVGDSYYFIGKGFNDSQLFDWFEQSQSCSDNNGELVYGLTAEKMANLEKYILAKGYANGSVFATSGHSYNSISAFHWSTLGQPLTYNKWLPGHEPPKECNLSLQLIDGELYMIRTWDYDRYYICEYRTYWRVLWIFFCHPAVFFVGVLILCLIIVLVPTKKKKQTKDLESVKYLIMQ